MTTLNALAVTAEPLLRAIADHPRQANTALASVSGRSDKNLPRDLKSLEAAGLVTLKPTEVTEAGREQLAMLDRAKGGYYPGDQVPQPAATPIDGIAGLLHAQILPSHRNPRRDWDSPDAVEALEELAASVKAEDRLLQNLVVRPAPAGVAEIYKVVDNAGRELPLYELVAGERRHRAVGKLIAAGDWPQDRPLPALVTELDDAGHDRVALIENLKRRDLKPLEEARAFQRLVEGGMKTAELAEIINTSQRLVQQRLQLLELDEGEQARLEAGTLTLESARQVLANRPKPVDITPDEALIFLEAAHAAATAGGRYKSVKADYRLKAAVENADDSLSILKRYGVWISDDWSDGHTKFQFGYNVARDLLRQLADTTDLDLKPLGAAMRKAQLAVVHQLDTRANALSAHHVRPETVLDELTKDGRYLTPFFNPPFLKDPEHEQLVEQRKLERAEHDRLQAVERAAADAKEQKRKSAAVKVRELGLNFADKTIASAELIGSTLNDYGHPLPWRWTPATEEEYAELTDANGADISLDTFDSDDLLAFVMAAVNAAAGHAPVVAQRKPEDELEDDLEEDEAATAEDRPTFVRWIAEALQDNFKNWKFERCRAQAGHALDGYLLESAITFGDAGRAWTRNAAMSIADEFAEAAEDEPDADQAEG